MTATMARSLPPAFLDRTDADDVRADVESARGSTVEQRAEILVALCRMAAELTSQHAQPQRVLDWQDPLSNETRALLDRLRARYRPRA